MPEFLHSYFAGFSAILDDFLAKPENRENLLGAVRILKNTREIGSTVYIIGNGGSAAIAEHASIDFTKNAGLRALSFSGTPFLTTFSNDYGYEYVFQKAIEKYGAPNDVLMAVSSGGMSKNILRGCVEAKKKGMTIITFSGFDESNALRSLGDINFWLDSQAYGYVEIGHSLLIHYLNDAIIGKVEYKIF